MIHPFANTDLHFAERKTASIFAILVINSVCYYFCADCFDIAGVIYLTADINQIPFPSSWFPLEVSATDGGHPPLKSIAVLRVEVGDVEASVNETLSSGEAGWLLSSALASDRLATALAVLLAGVVLTIAATLLSTVLIERRRRCGLTEKLANCCGCLSTRETPENRQGKLADVLTMTCCCCCCVNDAQNQQKCKTALQTDGAAAAAADVSGNTSTDIIATVRRVSMCTPQINSVNVQKCEVLELVYANILNKNI